MGSSVLIILTSGDIFLHISATLLTEILSLTTLYICLVKLLFSSKNLKHLTTSIKGTKLFNCSPPENNFISLVVRDYYYAFTAKLYNIFSILVIITHIIIFFLSLN